VVSLGHTEATAVAVSAAGAAGATCLTHLGNAMPPLRPREPGPIGAAFGDSSLVAGLIVDGHHLDPLFVRTAWRSLGPSRFLSVSDTTAALGMPDGPTRLGDHDVVLAAGAVRLLDGTLAGSAASLLDCLRVLVAQTGCTVQEAVATATETPLRLLGLGPRSETVMVSPDLQLVP
jgi:N-acetylglucosamine-6-phosphate deacetylase